jgi:atypical dual specificity phosphatase
MLSFPGPKWQAAIKPLAPYSSTRPIDKFGRRIASPILPGLYLSDYYTARSAETLERLGVTHVVSCIETTPEIPESVKNERKLHVPIADRADVDLLNYIEETTRFIRAALEEEEGNVVLVLFQIIIRCK